MKIKQVIAPLSQLVSQKNLVNWTGRSMILPFYHAISDNDLPYISNLYSLRSIKEFKEDLDYFCKYFTHISLEEVYQQIHNRSQNQKPTFHLTFDDGLKEVFEIIAPILEERGIPATFFVNSDFVDNKKLFYRYKVGLILDHLNKTKSKDREQEVQSQLEKRSKWNIDLRTSLLKLDYNDQVLIGDIAHLIGLNIDKWLAENKPYMTAAQIRNLMDRGFTIGSHSADHPRFKNIDLSQQKNQIEESFAFLEEHFGIIEKSFSFPFGDEGVSAQFFDWLSEDAKCKVSFGVSGIKDDYCPTHLHRIPMDDCNIKTDKFIKTEYLYFMIKSIFNKNQIKRN